MQFSFTHPQYLFFLFLIPLFFLIHFFSLGNRKKLALRFANFDAISKIRGIDFFSKNLIVLFLNSIIALMLIFALSGLTVHTLRETSSFSFVVVVDSSQSMEANDFFPNRITVAKDLASDFVDQLPAGVKVGVVSFSGNSYIQQDLSEDKIQTKNSINKIKIDGWGGTDLYDAIVTASNMLYDEDNKAIILLSDGQINIGKVEDIIFYVQKNDILIHSIAIGTLGGGQTSYAISKLDEESLQAIAYNSGGKYFLAEDGESLLKSLYSILDLTEKKVSIILSNQLILLAILFFALEVFLINTRYINVL